MGRFKEPTCDHKRPTRRIVHRTRRAKWHLRMGHDPFLQFRVVGDKTATKRNWRLCQIQLMNHCCH